KEYKRKLNRTNKEANQQKIEKKEVLVKKNYLEENLEQVKEEIEQSKQRCLII
ncbi:15093_t:CDS:1, partial [Dentiscutata heterogama]